MDNQRIPQVSIILCTYNRADLLSFAIQSVLDQTFQNWELLILDDASTDNTDSVIKKYLNDKRIRYIKHSDNLGITKNRNFGLKGARGTYIAVLDSDDVWLDRTKLEAQAAYLDTHSEYVIVGTFMIIIDEKDNQLKKITFGLSDYSIRKSFLIRNQIAHSSAMYRKEAALRVGGYDESLPIWEDWDLWLQLGARGSFGNLPTFALGYRQHGKNISNKDKKKGVDTSLQIIKRHKKEYPNYWIGWLKLQIKRCFLVFNF